MTYMLRKTGWKGLGEDPDVSGVILLVINAGGHRYCIGTEELDVPEFSDGNYLHFFGAILNEDLTLMQSADIFDRRYETSNVEVTVMAERFPIAEIRKQGIILQNITVKVYWYIKNRDMALEQAYLFKNGYLVEPSYNEERHTVSFRISDEALISMEPFPPVIATTERFINLVDEYQGKPYPIIIGAVKQLPIIDIDSTSPGESFLVMQDPFDEFSGSPVTAIYDGDATGPPTILTQSNQSDALGDGYWRTVLDLVGGTAAVTKDVTADVTGHTPATVDETIKYLLRFYGSSPEFFDLASLDRIKKEMSRVILAMVFNTRDGGSGVIDIVSDRLARQLPMIVADVGNKYEFWPIKWDRQVTKHLSFDKNIIKKVSGPTETSRSRVYNSFTVRYYKTNLRGDFTGCVTKDDSNSVECRNSMRRYGKRAMPDFDAGDIANADGAQWVLDWLVETYSRMRVFVSYECTLDVANVQVLDTVRAIDKHEDWDSLFKVIGIKLGTGSSIVLDLVSIDDYATVYGINS